MLLNIQYFKDQKVKQKLEDQVLNLIQFEILKIQEVSHLIKQSVKY